jgi:hypothetical protein
MRTAFAWSSGCEAALTPQQERHRVLYKSEVVGEYVPDLVVRSKLIVDTKTIERITDHERGQMLNYLRITGLPVGVILNFKHARLEWERLVLTKEPRGPQVNANERQLGEVDFHARRQCP